MDTNRYKLNKPFFVLAPMANITTYPFASQAVAYGADLVWTPMVHTDVVLNNWPEAEKILNFRDIENYIVQLVGSDPNKFAASVAVIEKNLKPLGIDLNFACPDRNIVKSGCGGALMQEPDKMFEIIDSVKAVTNLPVSVKTRAGWDNSNQIVSLAPQFIEHGVEMITIHPRTVVQKFTGQADWSVISNVKRETKNTKCLIVGSGDVKTWEEAWMRQSQSNCDGVMIGRSTLGSPWIFDEIRLKQDYRINMDECKDLTLALAVKAEKIWGEKGVVESRTHFSNYFKGFDGAKKYRAKLMKAKSAKEIREILYS